MNTKLIIVALLTVLLGSCMEDKESVLSKEQESTLQTFQLAFNKQEPKRSRSEPIELITKVSIYLFQNNLFYQAQHNIEINESENISFSVLPNSKLYFISSGGTADSPSLPPLEEGKTTLSAFLALTSTQGEHTATEAPPIYSALFTLTEENKTDATHLIQMIRAVARFDIDSSYDSQTKINRVIIENAAATTLFFPSTSPAQNLPKCTYNQMFDPALDSGMYTDLFRIYESNEPIYITVHCTYKNLLSVVRLKLPLVKRNTIYKIIIKNVGADISGVFEVKEWEEGETTEGRPDATEKIVIDKNNSEIPENVTIGDNQNEIMVPNSGAEMILAFSADTQVHIATTDGQNSDVSITDIEPSITSGRVLSKFRIAIAPQRKGRLPYDLLLNIKSVLQNNVYDQVRISVAASDYQIEEVQLGTVTWMAFNARTRALEDQIYLLDGCSVEDMYEQNWLATIGGIFQWGRLHMYIPWTAGSTNAGNQTQNKPWRADTHVPCPDGYRIPTKAELHALLPNNQPIPGTYHYNGEAITAELHTAAVDFQTPTNLTGKSQYISLTSQTTGEKLFIPLAGNKGDKSTSANPSLGQGIVLWCDDNSGATGGHAWVAKYWPGNNPTANVAATQLAAEAYAYVRCMKK